MLSHFKRASLKNNFYITKNIRFFARNTSQSAKTIREEAEKLRLEEEQK
jgi:hypothetical protein